MVERVNVPAIIPAGLMEDLVGHSLVIRYESGDRITKILSFPDEGGIRVHGDPVLITYGHRYFEQRIRLDDVAEIIVRDPMSETHFPVCRWLRTPTGRLLRCTE